MCSILHPTDFSRPSALAFAHALRIAIAAKARFFVVNATRDETVSDQAAFPRVRRTLAGWGLADENESEAAIADRLGLKVTKVGLLGQDPVTGILDFLDRHPCDLIVLATRGREGLPRWLHGSVAETVSRRAETQTLFISPRTRAFVEPSDGVVRLRHVLVPVDHEPPPVPALDAISRFPGLLGAHDAKLHLLHVGDTPPVIRAAADPTVCTPVDVRTGDVVETILEVAHMADIDLIAMPTAGHDGFLDAVRGSTTERVLRHAPCPVLAVPAR